MTRERGGGERNSTVHENTFLQLVCRVKHIYIYIYWNFAEYIKFSMDEMLCSGRSWIYKASEIRKYLIVCWNSFVCWKYEKWNFCGYVLFDFLEYQTTAKIQKHAIFMKLFFFSFPMTVASQNFFLFSKLIMAVARSTVLGKIQKFRKNLKKCRHGSGR